MIYLFIPLHLFLLLIIPLCELSTSSYHHILASPIVPGSIYYPFPIRAKLCSDLRRYANAKCAYNGLPSPLRCATFNNKLPDNLISFLPYATKYDAALFVTMWQQNKFHRDTHGRPKYTFTRQNSSSDIVESFFVDGKVFAVTIIIRKLIKISQKFQLHNISNLGDVYICMFISF